MTHTIKGKCGKCEEVKTTEFEEKILREFRERYGTLAKYDYSPTPIFIDVKEDVEQFLLKAIREAREDERKKVIKIMDKCGIFIDVDKEKFLQILKND